MKKKIFGGLLILLMMLAGCAGKNGNLPDNTDDTGGSATIQQVTDYDDNLGNGNEDIVDPGNINTPNDNDPATKADGIDWAEVEREAYRLTGNGGMLLPASKADGDAE